MQSPTKARFILSFSLYLVPACASSDRCPSKPSRRPETWRYFLLRITFRRIFFVGINIVKHLAMKGVLYYPEETVSQQFERYVARFPSIRLSVMYSVSAKFRYKRSASDSTWKSKWRKRNDIFSRRRDRRRRGSVGCTSPTSRKLILVDYDLNRTTPLTTEGSSLSAQRARGLGI